ncbi:MAG: HIT family protein [Nanoarchaeota archaeon]|nr:HIT family protein [Nanoarchaeota archaeon]
MDDCIMCNLVKNKISYSGMVKHFKHWSLMVSREQHTLGTFILVLNQHKIRFSSLDIEELKEMKEIMLIYENVIDENFHPNLYNYLQCGNAVNHLHIHIIPRYNTDKRFMGQNYTDKNFGNTVIETSKIENEKIILALKDLFL